MDNVDGQKDGGDERITWWWRAKRALESMRMFGFVLEKCSEHCLVLLLGTWTAQSPSNLFDQILVKKETLRVSSHGFGIVTKFRL